MRNSRNHDDNISSYDKNNENQKIRLKKKKKNKKHVFDYVK